MKNSVLRIVKTDNSKYIDTFWAPIAHVQEVTHGHLNADSANRATVRNGLISEAGIDAGLTDSPFTTFDASGITIGFVAFSPNRGTVNINDYENARSIIAHLDTIADIVIVSFHGGAEGPTHTRITRTRVLILAVRNGCMVPCALLCITTIRKSFHDHTDPVCAWHGWC